jgi:iron(III) transport system permease protein
VLAARGLALAVVGVVLVAPLATLFARSFRATEVVTKAGRALRVAGRVVDEGDALRFSVPSEEDPDAELVPVVLPKEQVVEVREVASLAHYRDVFRSRRTGPLLAHSAVLAGGSALLALLLGIPVGWLVARTTLPGRRVLASLLAAPLLLPPFFAAMGVSDAVGWVLARLGFSGGSLQLANAVVCFGTLLFPVPALLVGRALAAVPAGAVEAARLLAGPWAAWRRVVLPSALPAAVASALVVFAVALSDFAVPDLLGVFLPQGAVAVHVFATEVFLQWNKYDNVGRAVATGAPLVLLVGALLAVAIVLARRSPAGLVGHAARPRPPVRLRGAGTALGWGLAGATLVLAVAVPVGAVCAWGFSPARVPETVRSTAGLLGDADRWFRLGALAAVVTTAVAVVLARWALRGGAVARATVLAIGAAPLAVPGMTLMVGTLLLWVPLPAPPDSLWKGLAILVARFLPHALLASWLALREVGPGLEDAAASLGAGPATTARRVWGPLSRRGWISAALLVLVFALRELDSLVLAQPGILPVRIYDKVHFGKLPAVADLSMAYLAVLLVPAVVAAVLWSRRRAPEPLTGPPEPRRPRSAGVP